MDKYKTSKIYRIFIQVQRMTKKNLILQKSCFNIMFLFPSYMIIAIAQLT